ncbi:hypothetical protein H4582DRAFT_1196849 [Lactarius indigo]|nr:hypothetical protein H4582DRAFT_1196849 [Lactarius indigo]
MADSPVAHIRNAFGAIFIGLLVSSTLFGLIVVQACIYYWHYWNKDRKALKFFIGFLIVMEAVHTILCTYIIYWYLILHFGDIDIIDHNMWAAYPQINLGTIPGTCVQLYYARRIYIVSKSTFFPMVIAALLVLGNSVGIFFTVKEATVKRYSTAPTFYGVACVGMSAAVLVDIVVAAVMCWALYRKKTGFARTDSMIMTLMAYTVNTGLLTSFFGTVMTISFIVAPNKIIYMGFFWGMSKCYVNSLLAMLNSRDYVRERSSADTTDNSINLTSIQIAPPSEAYGSRSRGTSSSVTVHRSTAMDFSQNKSDHNVELGFTVEVPKPDTSTISSQGPELNVGI